MCVSVCVYCILHFYILQIHIYTRVENCLCAHLCECVCFKDIERRSEYADMLTSLTIRKK